MLFWLWASFNFSSPEQQSVSTNMVSFLNTVVSRKSAHGWSTQVCQQGVGAVLSVSAFNHKRLPMWWFQWFDGLEANTTTDFKVEVQTAHNALNGTMSHWALCSLQCNRSTCIHPSMQRCLVVIFGIALDKVLTSNMHSTWDCASQTPHKARSRVGAHSPQNWLYVGNWAKSRG